MRQRRRPACRPVSRSARNRLPSRRHGRPTPRYRPRSVRDGRFRRPCLRPIPTGPKRRPRPRFPRRPSHRCRPRRSWRCGRTRPFSRRPISPSGSRYLHRSGARTCRHRPRPRRRSASSRPAARPRGAARSWRRWWRAPRCDRNRLPATRSGRRSIPPGDDPARGLRRPAPWPRHQLSRLLSRRRRRMRRRTEPSRRPGPWTR